MLPNYQTDERILINQLAWGLNIPFAQQHINTWSTPQRGEVVLFRNPDDDLHIWMKRVIGVAGDRIHFYNHELYINGIVCSKKSRHREQLMRKDGSLSPSYDVWPSYLEQNWEAIIIPKGEVFLLGDNRGSSIDSRTWGSVSVHYLSGQPLFRLWPMSKMKWLAE